MSGQSYIGSELEIFEHARNWKRYWKSRIAPFVGGDVLEVGAGIGANTAHLRGLTKGRWLCLEPDRELLERCEHAASGVEAVCGTIAQLSEERAFDTILYIDVLEHIADDAEELARAALRLRTGGHIIVLSPSHQSLYSEFDRAIGHHRRYHTASLRRCTPPGTEVIRGEYLDSLGCLLSFANRALLRQSMPALQQILFWDRAVVPVSRLLDPLTARRIGKSILMVWQSR